MYPSHNSNMFAAADRDQYGMASSNNPTYVNNGPAYEDRRQEQYYEYDESTGSRSSY